MTSASVPEPGIGGPILADGRILRFGKVADATTTSGMAFEFALAADDAITARSHRCEVAFAADSTSGIPQGSMFWHAFAVKLPDWSGTVDDQSLAQWHAGDTSGGMLPIYTLLVRGNELRLVLRYDTSPTPSRATTTTQVVWRTTDWQPGKWLHFVTQARVSNDAATSPFVKTWLDDQLIVQYSGPVGYGQAASGVQPYIKHGIYHWIDSTNPWDAKVPVRVMRMKHPVFLKDPDAQLTQLGVRALLDAE